MLFQSGTTILVKYPILVYTKTVDSVNGARWLAPQTPDILCYLPLSNLGENGVRFASVTSEKIIQIVCGVYYLTVLVYTKTLFTSVSVDSGRYLPCRKAAR